MEEKFWQGLQRSPQEFLVLVQGCQSRSEKNALRSVISNMNGKTCSELSDVLSQSTAEEVFAFENLLNNPEANERFETPSPSKKRRRRVTRSHGNAVENGGIEPEIDPRKLRILKSLRSFSYLVQLCITHPHKAFSPSDLYPTVQTLHDKLVLFESDDVLQDSITALCELWWRESLPGRESLIAQSLPCLLSKSLSVGRKVDVHRIYAMREAFSYFDFLDDSIEDLKHLLIRCVVTPSYLRSEDGRRFVAFLFGLNAQLVKELIAIIRSQIPFGRNSILEAYGEILYRAWRVAKGSSLEEIENTCIQGLIEGAIYASSRTLASSIRKVLGGFIAQRTQEGVEAILFRLQEPILFRALQKVGIDDELQELLSWAGKLFEAHGADETSEDASPTVQGKRKRIQGQVQRPHRRQPLTEVSNTRDAERIVGRSETCRIVVVGRISATILKSIVDGSFLSLVIQVPVQARCLKFASAFMEYMKLHIGKQSVLHDWKNMLICLKSSGTYAAKLIYLCLKNSDELASEGLHLANNLLDLIALSESSVGSRFAMSLLAALKPWMPDLLIAMSFSVTALCNFASLNDTGTKFGFNELAEEGKRFSCAWIAILADLELRFVNIDSIQETDAKEVRSQEVNGAQASFKEDHEDKALPASISFIKTVNELLLKGHAQILQSVIAILLSQAALCLKTKDYNRTLGLLHFICGKLFGGKKTDERVLDIVPGECLQSFIEEINIYIENALESLKGDQDEWQKLQVSKGLIQNVLSNYHAFQ